MKKRIVGIIMVLIMCSTYVVMPEKAQAATLSDEMAEWFVNSFYTPGSKLATAVQKTLTGKMEPEESVVKSIYSKIAKYVGYADKFSPSTGDMAVLIHDTNELCKNVSAAINIVDNYKSMLESDLTIQKTVDALQVIKGFADLWGYGSYFPAGMGLALSTIESSIKVGGVLEQSYLQENLTMYEYELMIDYYAGNELTFRSAPTLALGTSVTQEQADAMYAACYLKYYFMQQTDDIVKDDSDIWSYTFISCCPEIANVTYYTEDIDTICDLIENGLNRQGYIFKGWYTDRSYTTPIYYDENFTSSGTAHKCYAKWQKRYYTINYNSNCNDVSNYSYQYDTVNNNWQENYTMSRDGYVFGGWYWDSACTNKVSGTFDIYDNMTFYAKWQKRYYTITYDSNCQEVENYYHQFDITLNNWLNNFEMKRPGYMFMGWYTNSACTTPIGNTITVDRDLHFYAKWVRQYNYTVSNGKATLTGFNGFRNVNGVDETDIVIPSTIDGYPVAKIGDDLFWTNDKITSVIISEGITEIGNSAFHSCDSLTKVTIPKSLKKIDKSGFAWGQKDFYITDLEAWCNIEFNGSVYWPSYNLYINGTLAEDITIPDSVKNIGDGTFSGCKSITTVTIPEGAVSISSHAFARCTGLKKMIIPDSVTNIGGSAFNGCESLTDITIPANVKSIGKYAFYDCKGLSRITIPDCVTDIGEYTFGGCSNLTDVIIGKSVKNIGSYAFSNCTNLKNIEIPESVARIEEKAFENCITLTNITFPKSLTSIGEFPFYGCDSLSNIKVDSNNQFFSSIDGNLYNKNKTQLLQYANGRYDDEFKVPNSVTSIGDYAFFGCNGLKSVIIGENVTSIGKWAFRENSGLTSATLGNNVTTIGDCLFYSCQNLKSVTIGNKVDSIGALAFGNCRNLTSIIIPESVTYIDRWAFRDCINLSNVSIPDSVTEIGYGAFDRCSSLTSITIPDGVTNVDSCLFSDCSSLTSVTIPNNVTSIGKYAFYNCGDLKNVYYLGSPEEWNNIQIASNNTLLTSATIYYAPSLLKIANGSLRVTAFPGKYNVILASYDSDGSLYDIKASECQFPNNGSTIMTIENPDSIVDVSTDGYVNAMFWDSLDSMIPLCEPEMILCNE